MKYLKLFEKDSDYQSYLNGSNFILPNVSYCKDTIITYYNPFKTNNEETQIVLPEIDTSSFNPELKLYNRAKGEGYYDENVTYVMKTLESYFYNLYGDSYQGFIIVYPNYTCYGFPDLIDENKVFIKPTIIVLGWESDKGSVVLNEIDISEYSVYQNYLSKFTMSGYSDWYDVTWDNSPIRQISLAYENFPIILETVYNKPDELQLLYLEEMGLVEWD